MIEDVPTERRIDFDRIEREVLERIHALRLIQDRLLTPSPTEMGKRLFEDLVYPSVRLLAQFCISVTFEDDNA